MFDRKRLGQFVATAQCRSMREAADALHMTSSALNRHILELEEAVGAQLFERHARGIRLSAAGEVYLDFARRTLQESEKAQSRIDELRGLRRGIVRLAVNGAMLDSRLIPVIAEFQSAYPLIEVSLVVKSTDEVVRQVIEHEVDIGIAFAPGANSEFRAIKVAQYAVHAIVPSEHPLAKCDSTSISDLNSYPIAIGARTLGVRLLLDEYFARTGFELRPSLVSDSFSALTQYIRAVGGVSFQLRPMPNCGPDIAGFAAVPIKELGRYKRPMVLGVSRSRVLPVAPALFVEVLQRELFQTEPQ